MEKQPTNRTSLSGFLKTYWMLILGVLLILGGGSTTFIIAGVVLIILHFVNARKNANQSQDHPEEPESQSAPSVGNLFSEVPAKPEEDPEAWVCEKCGATNAGSASVCEYCDSPREAQAESTRD